MVLQFVSPSCYAHIYSEKLVHLPHCYFVNDYRQVCLHAPCSLFPFFNDMIYMISKCVVVTEKSRLPHSGMST